MDHSLIDKIFIERATLILEDYCNSIDCNFDKLNSLLMKSNGIICGSLALYCFDNTFIPGDMDIFVFINKTQSNKHIYRELLSCFNDNGDSIKVKKNPVKNMFTLNNTSVISCSYEFTRHNTEQKRDDKEEKLLDVIIFNTGLDYFLERSNFVANEFYWNGTEWYIPVTSIISFLTYKIMPLKKLSSVDLLLMYEPWTVIHNIEEINSIFKPSCISMRNKLIESCQPKFSSLITLDHDHLNKFFNNICNDDNLDNNLDNKYEDKILSWIDIYRLMKTLSRVYKYINRGYQFPNLKLFLAAIYNSLPHEKDYQQQIITNTKITLDCGHSITIKDHRENSEFNVRLDHSW